jgi:hypothetical protein
MKVQLDSQQDLHHVQKTIESHTTKLISSLTLLRDPTEREVSKRYVKRVNEYRTHQPSIKSLCVVPFLGLESSLPDGFFQCSSERI